MSRLNREFEDVVELVGPREPKILVVERRDAVLVDGSELERIMWNGGRERDAVAVIGVSKFCHLLVSASERRWICILAPAAKADVEDVGNDAAE